MLSFTHNDKLRGHFDREFEGNLPFAPLVIHHNPKVEKKQSPSRKVLMKTVTGKPVSASTRKIVKNPFPSQERTPPKDWVESGKITGLFDTRLRKNQLAEAQRRVNKKNFKVHAEEEHQKHEHHPEEIKQPIRQVQKKRLAQTSKDKNWKSTQQVEHLKKLIEKEKQQKLKNDRIFQQQQMKLEKQRNQLKMIEKQINKLTAPFKGVPRTQDLTAVVQRQHDIPTHDRPEVAQTQEMIRQRNLANQRRLDKLMNTKDKLTNYNNPLNYTPTLIPLLSRASYKIVSTHISTITELLIDDILLEQVLVLEELQEKEQRQREARRHMNMVSDYMKLVGQLVRENDQIEHRVGRYDKVDLPNWYKPDLYKPFDKVPETIQIPQSKELDVIVSEQIKQSIEKNKRAFNAYKQYRDEYTVTNLKMFSEATEQIIDELMGKMVEELDKGAGQFVDVIFRNEFR